MGCVGKMRLGVWNPLRYGISLLGGPPEDLKELIIKTIKFKFEPQSAQTFSSHRKSLIGDLRC